MPEVIVNLGGVPLCPYALPGSPELPESLKDYLHQYDAFLLANHGAVTIGPDLFAAYYKMETIEHFAKILLTARLLGGAQGLPTERVQELYGLRERFGLKHPAPRPSACRARPPAWGKTAPSAGLVSRPQPPPRGTPVSWSSGSPARCCRA